MTSSATEALERKETVTTLKTKTKQSDVPVSPVQPLQTDNPDSGSDLAVARRVLNQEASALQILAGTLDNSFEKAVQLFTNTKGRIIITGMGKSGHVARKIAATLASTGTPAFFVHPGEASHGDLGMIAPRDAVLALSNSGKVRELGDLVAYTRRFEIPLVAMTSNADSPLAQAADIVLLLPKQPEAGSLAMAPTTSTTMQIALGDAIAVALFERHGFTQEDYKVFHPGGSLGQQLAYVRDLMHKDNDLPITKAGTLMSDALIEMSRKSFGCVGITDPETGKLLGIITDGDLRRHMACDLTNKLVETVMTPSPRTIRENALAAKSLAMMSLHSPRITSLFVVDDEDRPVGLIHIHDLLRAGIA